MNVVAQSEILVSDHAGELPTDGDALARMPGVRRIIARLVMEFVVGVEGFCVFAHWGRVRAATGWA